MRVELWNNGYLLGTLDEGRDTRTLPDALKDLLMRGSIDPAHLQEAIVYETGRLRASSAEPAGPRIMPLKYALKSALTTTPQRQNWAGEFRSRATVLERTAEAVSRLLDL